MNARTLLALGSLSVLAVVACGSGGGGGSADPGSGPGEGASTAAGPTGSDGTTAPPPAADASAGTTTTDAADAGQSSDAATADAGPSSDASDAATANDDPFDPASATGAPLDPGAALARLAAASSTKLADATLMRRTRTCASADASSCGPWDAPVVHTQALLTYSGGVVTDYKTFSFPTYLVLFKDAGAPKLSVRHVSDYQHDPTASTRGVVFPFGATPMVNTYPIIYVWDFAPAPNGYQDLQGLLGDRATLDAREHVARFLVTRGVTTEIAALYRY